jgi:hypothetical protein
LARILKKERPFLLIPADKTNNTGEESFREEKGQTGTLPLNSSIK